MDKPDITYDIEGVISDIEPGKLMMFALTPYAAFRISSEHRPRRSKT
jgi:hypothetical protein